ncbi:phage terminase small subunit P27 family [Pediococcus pentosaceus]
MTKELPVSAPSYLKGTAKYMWTRIVPLLRESGKTSDLDRTLVEAFCINYQQMRDAYKSIQEDGQSKAVYKTTVSPTTGKVLGHDFAGFKRNPASQIIDSTSKNLRSIANGLGLSPQSRTDLLNLPKEEEGGKSTAEQLTDFFKGDKK